MFTLRKHKSTTFTAMLMALLVAIIWSAIGWSVSAFAQDVSPRLTDPGWQAAYWNNRDLSGTPTVVRTDRDLNFAWGTGSPDPAIPGDRFSARWYRYIDVAEGNYRFNTLSDDGIRLWVDGHLLIDQWRDQATTSGTATKILAAGVHLVQVEYYDNVGAATVRVDWMQADATPPTPTPTPTPPPPPPTFNNWKGEYFNNKSTSGTPAYTRDDAHINFDWGAGSPAPGVNADHFSVRWVRTVNFAPGNYRFSLYVDDGARLFVNGHTTIDAWRDQPATWYTGDIYVAGPTTLQLEYFEGTDRAVAQLSWQQLGGGGQTPTATPPPPPPSGNAVIVDDSDANFARGGSERGWVFQNEGYNNSLSWTQNNDYARPNYNWGRWYPRLERRYYEVFVYIPNRFTTTGRATYWVSHAGGLTKRVVNQSANGGNWVSLGTYLFQGNRNDYLSLADVTGERYLSRLITWDAAKWEPR